MEVLIGLQCAVISVVCTVVDQAQADDGGLFGIGDAIAIAIDRLSIGCGDDFSEPIAVVIAGLDVGGAWCGICGLGVFGGGICGLRC